MASKAAQLADCMSLGLLQPAIDRAFFSMQSASRLHALHLGCTCSALPAAYSLGKQI